MDLLIWRGMECRWKAVKRRRGMEGPGERRGTDAALPGGGVAYRVGLSRDG